MITDIFLTMLLFTLNTIKTIFPDGSPLAFVIDGAEAFSQWVGAHAGPLDRWIPVHEAAFVMGIELVVVGPALVAYEIANWIFRHIPWVAAGG